MICQNCASGAAAHGEVARDLLHQQCTGCPCQHREPAPPRLLARIVHRGRERAEMVLPAEELGPLIALADLL